jgi:ABC-type multidrug transport system fused ATPase/permease subunit
MGEDYIRTARAKGLPERTVIIKHALRATLTPIITIFGLDVGLLLGGAGAHRGRVLAARARQVRARRHQQPGHATVMGVTMFAAFFVVVANFIVDLVYGVGRPESEAGLMSTTAASEVRLTRGTGSTSFLELRELRIHFPTDDGLVRAVDPVSFKLERGRTLGIVGESGSGKSVTSLGILGLHNKRNANVSGEIWLDGEEIVGASPRRCGCCGARRWR